MRKIIASELVSLDGFLAGPNGEIDWMLRDEDHEDFSIALLDSIDTIIFGRLTYDEMYSWWPTPAAAKDEPEIAERMNSTAKLVFSRTLDRVDWNNARLAGSDIFAEIRHLKAQPGKDIVIFGSGTIVSQLGNLGLIDEYWLHVHPVVLGAGRPLFYGLSERQNLKLTHSTTTPVGVVKMHLLAQWPTA